MADSDTAGTDFESATNDEDRHGWAPYAPGTGGRQGAGTVQRGIARRIQAAHWQFHRARFHRCEPPAGHRRRLSPPAERRPGRLTNREPIMAGPIPG